LKNGSCGARIGDASAHDEPETELQPRRWFARRGIAVDAPLVRGEEIEQRALAGKMDATLDAAAILWSAAEYGTVDSHPSRTAGRKEVCTAPHRPVDPERELARPRVVIEFGVTIVRSIRGPMVCQAGTRSNSRSTTCRETWCTTPAMSNQPTR